MKKITAVLCFVLFAAVAVNAQEFKKFRLATGLGYAIPGGEGSGGGVLWNLEPGYRVSDALLVSLRIETAVVARGISESSAGYSGEVAGLGSYTVNGAYYLSNNKFRPYVGAGLGIFSLAAVSVSSNAAGATAESKIGFYPRFGFDLGHFNINLDYNLIGKSTVEGVDFNGNATSYDIKNSYVGIRIGGFFFGGRK